MIKYFIVFFTVLPLAIFSQNVLSNQAKASILTCGNGNQLYSVFGHTAIRIVDQPTNTDLVYNYGTFDFSTPNFYLKFVKGDLMYQLSVTSFEDFMYEYQVTNREVWEQKLNFSPSQVVALYQSLNNDYFSDNKKYIYKFIDKNCTSKTTDKINEILGKEFIKKIDDQKPSYRQVLNPYFKDNYWAKLGINAIFGAKVDYSSKQLFLPVELLNSLDKAVVNHQKVISEKVLIHTKIPQKIAIPWWNSAYLLKGFLLFLAIFINRKIILISLSIFGILGLFFASVGLFSLHQEILWNYNILLFNPLYFVLIYFYLKNNLQKVNLMIYILIGLLIIYQSYLIYIHNYFILSPLIIYVLYSLIKFKKIISVK